MSEAPLYPHRIVGPCICLSRSACTASGEYCATRGEYCPLVKYTAHGLLEIKYAPCPGSYCRATPESIGAVPARIRE